MMQFYQKRDFGALIGDTFTFFKTYGRNYFRNYFLINGILLILLVVVFILFYREFASQIFDGNADGQSYYFETYFNENQGILIFVFGITFILFVAIFMMNYIFPVLYMKRASFTGKFNISSDEMLADIKSQTPKIFKLILGMMFVVAPLSLLVFGVTYALVFIFIGIFLMLFVFPVFMNFVNFIMFDYLHTNRGFFESLSYAMRAQFSYPNGRENSPFWKYWGSVIVTYLIINVVVSAFTMIPMFFMIFQAIAMEEQGHSVDNPFEGTMGIIFFVFYGISMLASFILMNILYVNSGLMYYDSRTDLHRKVDFEEINLIGKHEE